MKMIKTAAFLVILLSIDPTRIVVGQEEGNNTEAYQDYDFRWRNESFVEICPSGGPPPFSLDDPFIDSRVKGVIMRYTVQVPDPEWITFQVFDYDCQTEIPTAPEANATANGTPIISGLDLSYGLTNTASLNLEINPYGLQEYGSLIYTETERSGVVPEIESRGNVRLCVKLSIWNGFPPSHSKYTSDVVEVVFQETQVTFGARFTVDDEQYLDFTSTSVAQRSACTGPDCRTRMLTSLPEESSNNVPPAPSTRVNAVVDDREKTSKRNGGRAASRHLCAETWGVQVFTCPANINLDYLVSNIDEEVPNNAPVPDSGPVRLCIQPNAVAVEAGATLKDVESLYYDLNTGTYPLRQTAIEQRSVSLDGLTGKECGEQICIVETTLSRDFLRQKSPQALVAMGRVFFQPSAATVYNQVDVDFVLEFELEGVTQFSSAPRAAFHSFLASWSTILLGFVTVGTLFLH